MSLGNFIKLVFGGLYSISRTSFVKVYIKIRMYLWHLFITWLWSQLVGHAFHSLFCMSCI